TSVETGEVTMDEGLAKLLQPLIWTRAEGYRLDPPVEDLIAYEMAQFETHLSRIARFLSATVDPHFAKTPKDEWIGLVHDQINGVRAGLKGLTMLEPPPERRPGAARVAPRRRRVRVVLVDVQTRGILPARLRHEGGTRCRS